MAGSLDFQGSDHLSYCRRDWIRTSGPYVPNVVLYQTEPHAVTNIVCTFLIELSIPNMSFFYILCGNLVNVFERIYGILENDG